MPNSTVIGLKNLVYSILTKDDSTGIAYGTVKNIADAMSSKITNKTNTDIVYADDGPSEVITVQAESTLELDVKFLTQQVQADLLGHSVVGGALIRKQTDMPPYAAIGFKTKKSNNKYRYVWLLKGKFEVPDQESQTLEAKANMKYPKLKGTFIKRAYDDEWEKETDEDDPGANPTTIANWFSAVENPDVTIPSIASTVPANNATGVAENTSFVWTFSEAMDPNTITTNTLYLIKDTDGSIVPGTITYNVGTMTATFVPSGSLTTGKYIAVATADVADLDGIHIVPTNKEFTTV